MTKQEVQPVDIEKTLNEIWKDLQGKNKMRACLYNMIIYAKKDRRAGYLQKIAQKTIEKFPSRIIFIIEDQKTKEDYIKSNVSVLQANEGESEIFCDFIEIEISSSYRKRVPFAILPHLLPDLPLYVLWGDDPSKEDSLSFNLEKFATRTIFDSESADSLIDFANAIFKHQKLTNTDIADLNWARIEDWRNLFASTFYSKEQLELLKQTKEINISFNCIDSPFFSHTKTQSIFLGAWIAAQLNWKCTQVFEKKNELVFEFNCDNSSKIIRLIPATVENLRPGRIVMLEIMLPNEHRKVFKRKHDFPHHIIIESCNKDVCELSSQHIFEREESGKSLVHEICHEGTSQHYINMLLLISNIEKGNI